MIKERNSLIQQKQILRQRMNPEQVMPMNLRRKKRVKKSLPAKKIYRSRQRIQIRDRHKKSPPRIVHPLMHRLTPFKNPLRRLMNR